jgi:hypothetical protein
MSLSDYCKVDSSVISPPSAPRSRLERSGLVRVVGGHQSGQSDAPRQMHQHRIPRPPFPGRGCPWTRRPEER